MYPLHIVFNIPESNFPGTSYDTLFRIWRGAGKVKRPRLVFQHRVTGTSTTGGVAQSLLSDSDVAINSEWLDNNLCINDHEP